MKLRLFREEKVQEWLIVVGLLSLLVILLIPTLYISRFSFRQADDFAYADTAWKSTHSIIKTLVFEFQQNLRLYREWQGLYSADFIYLLTQTLLGEHYYFLTPRIAIFSLAFSEIVASKIVFQNILHSSFRRSLLVSLPIILFQISVPISACEAFYWLCSVILYPFVFSIYILITAYLLKCIAHAHITTANLILLLIGCFFIGGINYIFSLPFACFLCLGLIYAISKRNKNMSIKLSILFVTYLLFLGINVFSPGASARIADASELTIGPVKAILLSFSSGVKFIGTYWHFPLTLLGVAFIPLFVKISSETTYKFKFPLLFTVISFSLYCSQFTPCMYALGFIGAYRVQNIYLFTMLILFYGNIFYWIGYIKKQLEHKSFIKNLFDKIKRIPCITLVYSALFMGLILYYSFYVVYGFSMTPFSAYRSIKQGEAEAYYQQWQERLELLNDDSIKECEFEPYVNAPYTLFFQDLTDNKIAWQSPAEGMALYYGKTSIKLKEKED